MPTFREVTLPAGTTLRLKLTTGVASDTSQVEDTVRAELRQAVTVDGQAIIPAGTEVAGTVTDVRRPGRVKGTARIARRAFETAMRRGRRLTCVDKANVFRSYAFFRQVVQEVGADFPVFLHPDTGEEYALARTERKTGAGYRGFVTDADESVTLEDDLRRRDFTINAMARDHHGRLIDPYGGRADLAARVLRHVSPAFVEDPLRVLRAARFAARFDFRVAPETLALMREISARGL